MTRKTRVAGLLFLALLALPSAALFAQQTFNTTIYLDYRYYLTSDGPTTLKPASDTTAYLNNQFVFRRAYFTYENKINDNLKFRFRLDADNTANVTGVSLTGSPVSGVSLSKDDKFRPFIKHLYLQWSNFLVKDLTLKVGMTETLTFNLEEARWNYRSVAKTIVDGYKDITGKDISASSADIGASLGATLGKYATVTAMVANGRGYGHTENDQYKKFSGQLMLIPVKGVAVVGYIDYSRMLPQTAYPEETAPAATTYKFDGYFEMVKGLVLGGTWFTYRNDLYQTVVDDESVKYHVDGWSVFGRYALNEKNLNVFARYDGYMPNSENRDLDMNLLIVGLDWAPLHKSMKLQPNIWFTHYKDGTLYNANATSCSDVVFNMTFFLSF
jgi:hypothetical protein